MGDYDPSARIFTLAQPPPQLDLRAKLSKKDNKDPAAESSTIFSAPAPSPLEKPTRTDINIGVGGLAFFIDNILSPDEADALAAVSETMGYSRFAPAIRTPPGMRRNKACHWIASEETAARLLRPLYARFRDLLPERIGGAQLHSELSHRMAHYKYDDGDVFNRHTDGCWPGQSVAVEGDGSGGGRRIDGIREWQGVESKMSMLLYLNDPSDGYTGGETRLFPLSRSSGHHTSSGAAEPVDVPPVKGGALFFRHGFGPDSVMHMGKQVTGETPKYVLRLNVLYSSAEDNSENW